MDHDVIEYYKSLGREPRTWRDYIEMNKEDEMALEESISDWKDKARGINNMRMCPLCALGKRRNGDLSYEMCSQCIIKKHTGVEQCRNTPFWPRKTTPEYYKLEIEFLESLRPEEKVKKDIIETGDEVTIHDSSYLFRLNNGKIENRHGNDFTDINCVSADKDNTIYIVLETGTHLRLPEGSSHRGEYGNDTIIYNSRDGSYVFTYHKFLRLVNPEIPKLCPECGKAE